MYIRQVLNNNVLLVEDSNHTEKLIWGRGIGFGNKRNQDYELKTSDKIYTMQNSNVHDEFMDQFNQLLQKVPYEYFKITSKIIDIAKNYTGNEYDDFLLITLTDHIYFSVGRMKDGIFIGNPFLNDLRVLYEKEFAASKAGLKYIEETSGLKIPDDEAGYIAIHLIESKIDHGNDSGVIKTEILLQRIEEISNLVSNKIKVNKNDVSYNRFLIHLKYLLVRWSLGSNAADELTDYELKLYNEMIKHDRRIRKTLNLVVNYFRDELNFDLDTSEKLYLALHIKRLFK
ncbi:PRD domain-containing protein [Companilactobacillus huachuanensis]|uniref:PRD domain-containing protein n=1 Tax=Companilactobacillus huachuanensis TaxID=2559914 RepID=A0ABW1RNN5_9LACO|nr:PRD domain-containing protein [Companilactobacillus huachuanensis]